MMVITVDLITNCDNHHFEILPVTAINQIGARRPVDGISVLF